MKLNYETIATLPQEQRFACRCILDLASKSDKLQEYILVSSNFDDLLTNICNWADDEMKQTQAYAEASKACTDGKHWYRVRAMFDDMNKASSDAGGLKLMSIDGTFSFIIPNGYGDGVTRYTVADNFNHNMMTFLTQVEGRFGICSYDCGDSIGAELKGRFGVFVYQGIIAFERWN